MEAREPAESSRQQILSRIRAALPAPTTAEAAQRSWTDIARAYRRSSDASQNAVLELLIDRLQDYGAQVLRTSQTGVTGAIAQMLRARGVKTMLVPRGFPEEVLPEGFTYVRDEQLSPAELDRYAGVLTTSTVAIAETGTIVLQNAPGQGRRAVSLVPDYHLCVIAASQVVATVPEAMAALQPTATRPTTFISGPSATSDIEMTRIKGVHGPRFLDVVLIV